MTTLNAGLNIGRKIVGTENSYALYNATLDGLIVYLPFRTFSMPVMSEIAYVPLNYIPSGAAILSRDPTDADGKVERTKTNGQQSSTNPSPPGD